MLPRASEERARTLREAVREARRLTDVYTVRLPNSLLKRRAFESFIASA